jgi:hypothetical protein
MGIAPARENAMLRKLWRDDSGLDLADCILIVGIILLVGIVLLHRSGVNEMNLFQMAADKLDSMLH